MGQLILVIVLDCLLLLAHAVCATIIITWRSKRFRRQIHRTGSGLALFVFSLFISLAGILSTHLLFSSTEKGVALLFICLLFCPLGIAVSLHLCCFCVFIDGKDVVSRTLFSQTRIDLSLPGTVIDDQDMYGHFTISIIASDGRSIQFNRRKVSGDVIEFLESCRSIQAER